MIVIPWSWFLYSTFQLLCSLILVLLMGSNVISDTLCGAILLFLVIIEVIHALKQNKLFSPLTPCYIVEATFSLYIFKLVNTYEDLPTIAIVVIVLCMYIWKMVTYINPVFARQKKISKLKTRRYRRLTLQLWLRSYL